MVFTNIKIFSWNCQGCGHPRFHIFIREYCSEFDPDIMVLLEMRISGETADNVVARLGFDRSPRIDARGFWGGIWILWRDTVKIEVIYNHFQFAHCRIEVASTNKFFYGTFVHASPQPEKRRGLWESLRLVANSVMGPWIILGDFNAILSGSEKRSEVNQRYDGGNLFRSFIFDQGLRDLRFAGPRFTWNRGTTFEHLDRAIGNSDWDTEYPEAGIKHLHRLKSDHRPMLLSSGIDSSDRPPRPFRFLSSWLSHLGFPQGN